MVRGLKSFIAGFITCSILMGGIIVFGEGDTQIKSTLLNTFKFKLYGKDFSVKNASGAYLSPIIYNKTPYIPLQAVTKGIGVPVEYDVAKKIVWLGGKTEKVQISSNSYYKDYYGTIVTKDLNKLSTPDVTYKWGITNSEKLDMATFGCYLTPNSKYNKFKAALFMDAEVKMPLTITFLKDNYNTGEALATYELKPGETQDVEFDIGGVDKFYIIANVKIGHDYVTKLIIGEPVFFNEKPTDANKISNDNTDADGSDMSK